ncbi:unnamed protein product [Malus baccata var. baccata]
MCGALSIASSVLLPNVNVVVAFYGVPPSELAKSKASVQAHFGELDSFVGFSDVTVLQFSFASFNLNYFIETAIILVIHVQAGLTSMHCILQNLKVHVQLLFGIESSWKEVVMKLTVKSEDGAVSEAIHEIVENG